MGVRLHYLTEYKKEYSETARFSNCVPTINQLFEWLDQRNDYSRFWYDQDFPDISQVLEWDKYGVEDAINLLEEIATANQSWVDIPEYSSDPKEEWQSDRDWSMSKHLRDNLIYLEKTEGITPVAVRAFLWDAYLHCESAVDYIRFEWK